MPHKAAIKELNDELTKLRGLMSKQRREANDRINKMVERHKLEMERMENSCDYWKRRYYKRSEELRHATQSPKIQNFQFSHQIIIIIVQNKIH